MTTGLVIRLDASDAEVDDAHALAGQIPLASTLEPRTRVSVLATGVRKRGVLGRFLGDRKVDVPRATRCTALLVRGYLDVGANDKEAWGYA
jgi:hypothetical protein